MIYNNKKMIWRCSWSWVCSWVDILLVKNIIIFRDTTMWEEESIWKISNVLHPYSVSWNWCFAVCCLKKSQSFTNHRETFAIFFIIDQSHCRKCSAFSKNRWLKLVNEICLPSVDFAVHLVVNCSLFLPPSKERDLENLRDSFH